MLKLLRTNLAVRLSLLLFAIIVTGSLIGYAWESAVYTPEPSTLEEVEARADELLPSPAETRTPGEVAILERTLSHFPPYPGASRRPEVLAADYLGEDTPIAVAWFSTQDSPQKVLSYYRGTLVDAGLPPVSADLGPNGGYVGYWSPASEEVRLVSVLAQGGETLVFVSSGQMAKLLERGSRVPDWIPLASGVVEPQLLTFRMEGATNSVVSGKMEATALADAETAWRQALAARGWKAGATSEMDPQTRSFEVGHDGAVGQVMLRGGQGGVEFNLSVMQRTVASSE